MCGGVVVVWLCGDNMVYAGVVLFGAVVCCGVVCDMVCGLVCGVVMLCYCVM